MRPATALSIVVFCLFLFPAGAEFTRLEVGGTVYVLEGGPHRTGITADGVGFVISQQPVTVLRVEPEPSTEKGHLIHGAQLNPQAGEKQGYDQRTDAVGNQAYDPSKTADFPLVLKPGDILVKAVSAEDIPYGKGPFRYGILKEVSALLVLDEAPENPQGSLFAPAVIGWPERPAPRLWDIDLDALLASLPAYDASMIPASDRPDIPDVIERINRFNPLYMQNSGTNPGAGYQTFFPRNLPRPGSGNYGLEVVKLTDAAALLLISDLATPEQKRQLLTGLISSGIQWLDPAKGLDIQRGANGGHLQWFQSACLLAQHARGLPPSDVHAHLPGNWAQAFRITREELETHFVPHEDPKKPYAWFLREITAVDGNQITFQNLHLFKNADFTDQPMIRHRDGTRAMVTGPKGVRTQGKRATVNIDAQPGDPFVPGDKIYFGPQYPLEAGQLDWAVQAAGRVHPDGIMTYGARKNVPYRGLNKWSGGVLMAAALGILPQEFDAVRDYVAGCNSGLVPEGGPEPFETHHSFPFVQHFWEAHWDTVRAVPSLVDPSKPHP